MEEDDFCDMMLLEDALCQDEPNSHPRSQWGSACCAVLDAETGGIWREMARPAEGVCLGQGVADDPGFLLDQATSDDSTVLSSVRYSITENILDSFPTNRLLDSAVCHPVLVTDNNMVNRGSDDVLALLTGSESSGSLEDTTHMSSLYVSSGDGLEDAQDPAAATESHDFPKEEWPISSMSTNNYSCNECSYTFHRQCDLTYVTNLNATSMDVD